MGHPSVLAQCSSELGSITIIWGANREHHDPGILTQVRLSASLWFLRFPGDADTHRSQRTTDSGDCFKVVPIFGWPPNPGEKNNNQRTSSSFVSIQDQYAVMSRYYKQRFSPLPEHGFFTYWKTQSFQTAEARRWEQSHQRFARRVSLGISQRPNESTQGGGLGRICFKPFNTFLEKRLTNQNQMGHRCPPVVTITGVWSECFSLRFDRNTKLKQSSFQSRGAPNRPYRLSSHVNEDKRVHMDSEKPARNNSDSPLLPCCHGSQAAERDFHDKTSGNRNATLFNQRGRGWLGGTQKCMTGLILFSENLKGERTQNLRCLCQAITDK